LILAPHLVGAPQPIAHESAVPAGLASQYATASLAAAAVFWLLLGPMLAYARLWFERREAAR
jgi:predicted cobalt transporter CbtA